MDTIRAIVHQVIARGPHGPYAIATSDQIEGSVTFSLEPTVWKEEDWPEEGSVVLLSTLRQKRAGWRAKAGRFTRPSDEQRGRTRAMQFLYPTSRQFPFDEVCGQIVRELEQRNWQVPGIEVEFDTYGSGDQKLRLVRSIKSRDYKLYFCRIQRTMPGTKWNDTAAVSDIVIPKQELRVYEDESGPTFYLYAGNDWEKDRERFINGSKVNSKLNGEPKLYLEYKGGCNCRNSAGASFGAIGFLTATITGDAKALAAMHHTHPGRRPPLLVHTNDLNREYDPEGDEPTVFKTADVMEKFRHYLEDVVLKMITSYPVPSEKIDIFVEPQPIPFPESIGSLFCFGEYADAKGINQGKRDPESLDPANRYGLHPSGYRLLELGMPNDGTVPKIAYDGFRWCGIGETTDETPIDSLEIPGHYRWSDSERYVIRVKPDRANDIYIADHGEYEKRRREIHENIMDDRDFTNVEVADFVRARARTIVPIHEYKGGYAKPIVLINRELSFDEVEVVSGSVG